MQQLRPESLRTIVARNRGYDLTGVPKKLEYEPEILSIACQEWQLGIDFFPELTFNNGQLLLIDHYKNYYNRDPVDLRVLKDRQWGDWLRMRIWADYGHRSYGENFCRITKTWKNRSYKFHHSAPTQLRLKLIERKTKKDFVTKYGIGLPFGNEEIIFPHEYPEWWDIYSEKRKKEAHKNTYGYELIDYYSPAWWDSSLDISIRGKASEKAWKMVLECDWDNPDCERAYHNREQLCLGCCLINSLPALERLLADQKHFLQEIVRRRSLRTYDPLVMNLDYNRNVFMDSGLNRLPAAGAVVLPMDWFPPAAISNIRRPWSFSMFHLFQPGSTKWIDIRSEILCRICERICNDWIECPDVIYDTYRKYSITMRYAKRRLKHPFRVCGTCNSKYFRYNTPCGHQQCD